MTREFLESQDRGGSWKEIKADSEAHYHEIIEIDLSQLEPMIASPSSPDNVTKVSEIEGITVNQVIVGSSANSSFRDLMISAKAMEGRHCHPDVSFEINPGSNQALLNVTEFGGLYLFNPRPDAHTPESGCLGCIGMGSPRPAREMSLYGRS